MILGCPLCRLLDAAAADRAAALERGDWPGFVRASELVRSLSAGYEERPA